MNSYLTPKISSFFVANLRNSQLLHRTGMCKCRDDRMSRNGRVIRALKEPMGSVLRVSREAVKLRDELKNLNFLGRNLLRPE